MEVHVSDLTWDQFIYPRGVKSEKTIDAYVETLAIGAQFPPIKIQRVFKYPSSPPFNKGGKGGFSDERFGDDWPGRIPAQLIAHTLFYFTKPGDLVLDPMAGGVVSDVCLLFERKCQAFDLAVRDNRHEILCHLWDPRNWKWPITKKPDLIFFDPPYYIKKEKAYRKKANENTPSISSYTKDEIERFLKGFFLLVHKKSKETTSYRNGLKASLLEVRVL